MSVKTFFKNPLVYPRIFEWIFSLIAFATCASLKGDFLYTSIYKPSGTNETDFGTTNSTSTGWDSYPSYAGFMIFTGVTGWLISMIYLVLYGINRLQTQRLYLADAVISFIWMVFFLSASAAMAANSNKNCGDNVWNFSKDVTVSMKSGWCDTYKASVAFGFLTWILFVISTGLAVFWMKKVSSQRTDMYRSGVQMT